MPYWIRQTLLLVITLCCVVIGMRIYLEITADKRPAGAGPVAGAPERLPEFVLNDMWGEPTSISKWAGKPLLINFWATWCAPCRREMPLLQALHNQQPEGGIRVVGIAIDRLPDVESYITESGISYPILVGQEDAMAVSDLFGLEGLGLPFSVLAAGDGHILTVYVGELVGDQIATMARLSTEYAGGKTDLATVRERLRTL
ncbi:MAG: TlpA disulfide reductase family protein [Gammaproteobacteria bacterium]|jgi:thiol-disulfide isomerase/thioredoxin|nr:TlpA disulfide reductase family protein [Gammaproteobacteria bacterium]MDP6617198.1 TlpA disulfide reductase family protein [Gammaproteobacteria bacterium]MDP6695407.1 TlpA disulfide reductase family protein [Gammaproteobacteria bacterium]MDP7041587.1 TlpA disulfide reductase family protein [Gammaproteobacteria bacterium]